jgi:sugar phosphate isomerase/epimerase
MPTLRLALEAGADTLVAATTLGITAVPIDGQALLKDGVTATLAPLRERHLTPCQVGAFFFNPLDPDLTARAAAAAKLARLIPLAAEAGCPWIAFAAGSLCADIFGGADPANLHEPALAAAARELAPLATLAERHGVRLTLEPHIRSVIATPERAAALCTRVGSSALRVTFDVSNFYDFFALLDSTEIVRRCGTALAPHTGLIHLKEIAVTNGFHLHAGLVPMGQGRTNWTQVLAAAAPAAPSDSWVLIEHCAHTAEATASVALVRAAAQAAQVTLA